MLFLYINLSNPIIASIKLTSFSFSLMRRKRKQRKVKWSGPGHSPGNDRVALDTDPMGFSL